MPLLRDEVVTLRDRNGFPRGGRGIGEGAFGRMNELMNQSEGEQRRQRFKIEQLVRSIPREGAGTRPHTSPSFAPQRRRSASELEVGLAAPLEPSASFLELDETAALRRSHLQASLGGPIVIDWWSMKFKVNQKARSFMSSDQVMEAVQLIQGWASFASDLTDAVQRAEEAIARVVSVTSQAKRSRLAVGSKVVWLVLTTAAPPPWGALVGALVRAVLGTDTWQEALRRSVEWTIQAPFPHTNGKADFFGEWRPWVSGKDTKSPALNYIGGHPSLRELKDSHQLLNQFERMFTGSQRELFDKMNKNFVTAALNLPAPQNDGGGVRDAMAFHCSEKVRLIQRSVQDVVTEYGTTESGAARLVHASLSYQEDGIAASMHRYADPVKYLRTVMKEGVDLYLNTLAFNLMELQLVMLDGRIVPQIDMQRAQREFEILFMALYLSQNIEEVKGADAGNQAEESFWSKSHGRVSKKIWTGEVESKLNALGITQPHGGAVLGTGRTEPYRMRIVTWGPPDLTGAWLPVPYQAGGDDARGRLAAWALNYRRRYERSPEQLVNTFLGRG